MRKTATLSILALISALTIACDPEHRKKCEWYLVPDIDRPVTSGDGLIPVCARNYVTNKQDCRLQAPLDYAKSVYNKKFRYVDLKVESLAIPRTVKNIKFCE